MNFTADMRLSPKGRIEFGEYTAIGYLILEVLESEVSLCKRRFEIEYSTVQNEEHWIQLLVVKDGQEQIFSYQGLNNQKNPRSELDKETSMKFDIFFRILDTCIEQDGAFKGVLSFSDPLSEAATLLFRLCRGRVQ